MGHVKLDLAVDDRDFVKGVDNAGDALNTLIDQMDDTAKESLKDAKKIEAGLKDVTEAAKDTERATKPIGKGFKDASKEASQGMDDLSENSKSNAKEVAASFDGSAQSIVDGFQGLAAEAFEGFGPAGIAAGVAIAAGIGLATQAFEQNAAQSEEAKARIRELGLAIIESGSDAASLDFISENLKAIISDGDDATKKFADIEEFLRRTPRLADKAGLLALAYSGNADAIDLATEALEAEIDANERSIDAGSRNARALSAKNDELQREIDALEGVATETERAQQVEDAWLASGGAEIEAKRNAIASINEAYDEVVFSIQDFVNEESKTLDVDAYLRAIDERTQALTDYQNNLAQSDLTTAQRGALDAMGIDAAATWFKGYQSTSDVNKKRMRDSLTTAASESSGAAKQVLDNTFKTPSMAKVAVSVDQGTIDAGRQAIRDGLTGRNSAIKIPISFVTSSGRVVN